MKNIKISFPVEKQLLLKSWWKDAVMYVVKSLVIVHRSDSASAGKLIYKTRSILLHHFFSILGKLQGIDQFLDIAIEDVL